MSKELLEKMNKKVIGLIDSDGDFADEVKMSVDVYAWFYRQADERVRKLEARELAHKLILNHAKEIEQQNKRYRDIIKDFIDYSEDYNISRVEKYHLQKSLESDSDA